MICPFTQKDCTKECALYDINQCSIVSIAKELRPTVKNDFAENVAEAVISVANEIYQKG